MNRVVVALLLASLPLKWAHAQDVGSVTGAVTDKITGAVNLPLFLLEGVAILAEVFALLVLFLGR